MIEDIVKIFSALKEQVGVFGTIIILTVGTAIFLGRKKIFSWLMNFFYSVFQREIFRFNRSGIMKHPFFNKLKYLKNQRLKFLKCQCPLRKKIFSDLMIIRVNALETILTSTFSKENFSDISDGELQFKLSGMMYDIFSKWEEDARKEGMPEIIILRFVSSFQDIRDGIISYIQTSSNSYSNFKNNYAKIYALLDILSGFEELIIIRMELELDSMNGEISNSKYKGIQCEHCTVCQSTKTGKIQASEQKKRESK